LYPEVTLNYAGKLQPGLAIEAEVMKRYATELAVQFEVRDKGQIRFEHERIPNMATWEEMHTVFFTRNQRLLEYDL
jgi:hypothetical protein